MLEQMRAEERERRALSRQAASSSSSSGREDEGYWAYMQRQVQERTQNLGFADNSMDKLEENSSNFADDVNKFVSKQKKKAVMGRKSRSLSQNLDFGKMLIRYSNREQARSLNYGFLKHLLKLDMLS